MTLEQNGYKATGTLNRESALPELQQNRNASDAVITDLSMPGLSGLQLAHQIRKLRPDLAVILASGYIDPEDQVRADRLGIRAILTKPVNTKELLATLAQLFEKHPPLKNPRASGGDSPTSQITRKVIQQCHG